MKPATLVLIVVGSALGLVATGIAVQKLLRWPYTTEVQELSRPGATHTPKILLLVDYNILRQPLRASHTTLAEVTSRRPRPGDKVKVVEIGDFPNFVRHGHWTSVVTYAGNPQVSSDLWYIDGREVTQEEWEMQ